MALLNFTSPPFLAGTPNPGYYHHQPQSPPAYHYPTPQNPFLGEEFPHHSRPPPSPFDRLPPPTRPFPQQPPLQNGAQQPTYTQVTDDGTKTKVHAVIDYDYDEDEDGGGAGGLPPAVTPIQGPIFIKNGSVPVVPLYSHPVLNNGTFVQIPILWTALSVALGLELQGEYIRGVPCIKRNQQLFCPTAGNSYPLDRIELFIDENKALMKRMYGEFDMTSVPTTFEPSSGGTKRRRSAKPGVPDIHYDPEPPNHVRTPRQNFRNNQSESGRVDACESKVEIVTPYWASNSAGKIRAIVNTQHFEQAIHQEVCTKVRTNRCTDDCGCEQKYKWHRLLAYDPDNDCKGIFMDWFLFPSCCVCRCNPT